MPYLNITTNQEVKDKTQFIKKTSETVAKASGKPESYVMIVLNDLSLIHI